MKHLRTRPLAVVSAGGLVAAALAVAAPHAVFAGTGNASTQCSDGGGNDDLPPPLFITNPVTLGIQIGSPLLAGQGLGGATGGTYVSLCYATSSTTDTGPEATGGIVTAGTSSSGTGVSCVPDTDAFSPTTGGLALSCSVQSTGSGETLTVGIPFGVCFGTCITNPGVASAATGVIVGTIAETGPPPGGAGAAFALTSLCVEVNGVTLNCLGSTNLGGVTTTGHSPVDIGPIPNCGALICLPTYVGLSGAQLATVYIPGTNMTQQLFGVPFCVTEQSTSDPCTA